MNFGNLLFWVMVATSVGLSIASGYETLLGLQLFMPDGVIGWIMGFVFTLSVQMLLLAISWRIANHLLDPVPSQIPSYLVWVICAIFSGYFSYFGFFQATGGRDDNLRADKVIETQEQILREVRDDMGGNLNALRAEVLTGSDNQGTDAFLDWEDQHRELMRIASNARTEIQANARQREQKLSEERDRLRQSLDGLKADAANAQADVRIAQSRREGLQSEIEDLETRLENLTAQIVIKRTEVDSLIAQRDIERQTGEGPRYRQLVIDIGTAQSELRALEVQQTDFTRRLEARIQVKVEEDIKAEQRIDENRLNDILGDIDAAEARIEAISQEIVEARDTTRIDFSNEEQQFNTLITNLNNGDYTAYGQIVQSCDRIKGQMSDVGLSDSVSDIRCSDPALDTGIIRLLGKVAEVETFEAACNAGRVVLDRSAETISVQPVLTQLRDDCIAFAPNPQVRTDMGQEISRMLTERGDEALDFAKASVALLDDRQPNALISAFFAAIIDFLVLLCALVGRNRGQPESVRAIDTIIANVKVPEPGEEGYERRYVLPDEGNQRTLVQPIITSLLSDELADVAETEPGEPQVLLFRMGALATLKRRRASELKEAVQEVAVQTTRGKSPRSSQGRSRW